MWSRIGVLFALLIITVAGCRPASHATADKVDWTTIELPTGARPTTFGTDGQRLIIGGRKGTGPWLAGVDSSDTIRPVALGRHSPYAFTAEFVSVAVFDGRIAALGNVHGGAHGNSRWTVWTGDTSRITEYPQSLDTFGGVNGGDLAAIVINRNGPLITGSYRFGVSGLDGGIWLPDGTPVGRRWRQPDPTGTDLDTTRSVLVSVQTAAADHDQVVLAGSTTHLADGVQQVASVWLRPDGTRWRRIELPGAGKRSEALSLGCWSGRGGVDCLIAGTVDGQLAAWRLQGTHAERVTGLPAAAVDAKGPRPAVVAGPVIAAIAFDTGSGAALMVDSAAHWSQVDGPPGRLVSAIARGTTAYLITEVDHRRTLSRARLPAA